MHHLIIGGLYHDKFSKSLVQGLSHKIPCHCYLVKREEGVRREASAVWED